MVSGKGGSPGEEIRKEDHTYATLASQLQFARSCVYDAQRPGARVARVFPALRFA